MKQWFIKDKFTKEMSPLCDLRGSFEQRTGGLTTLERLTNQMGCPPSGFLCKDDLRAAMITSRTGLTCVTGEEETAVDHPTIETPWDIIEHFSALLQLDLERAEPLEGEFEVSSFGDNRIDVHPSATILPGVVFDASSGAIRIEEGAVIHPNAVLIGPCWIGKESRVYEHALLKMNTSIGPMCKVSGEIGGTVFQGYSNKCHVGHLGDSVVGEWVNFGAGTSNSNLLNTYGEVIVTDLEGKKHRTDKQYVGCFVGDHVKFAIETRIMTGTIVGTGAMIASTSPVPSPTQRFAWVTDKGVRTYAMDKFVSVANTVMARRNKVLDSSTEAVMRNLANT